MSTLNSRLQLSLLNRKKGQSLLEKGFTLVELMIVIVVVGILSAVAVPQFLGIKDKAQAGSEIGQFVGLAKECSSSILIEGPYPDDYDQLGLTVGGATLPNVSTDCNGGSTTSPPPQAANVVFTGAPVTGSAVGTVSCGPNPANKPAINESCEITVDTTTGAMSFAAV